MPARPQSGSGKPKPKARPKLIIEPTPQWYAIDIPTIPKPEYLPTEETIARLSSRSASLHTADTDLFHQRHGTESKSGSSSSITGDASFLQRVLHEGTLSDRLGALTLLAQGSPVHNVRALETLRSLAGRGRGAGGRGDALRALRCVVDWWVGGGAPPRKLKYFREQPLQHKAVTDQHLVLWHFEDWLKKYFFSVLQILETMCLDPLAYVRTQALTLVFTLLRDKPEQEQNLLRLLVNKLGDTEKSICSRASYYLLQLLQVHPAMKVVIVREMTAVILKPAATTSAPSTSKASTKHIRFTVDGDNQPVTHKSSKKSQPEAANSRKNPSGNIHARYYAAITFNQIVLTPTDREVALQLIDVYFEMFRELLGVKNSENGHEEEDNEDAKEKGKEARVDRKGRVVGTGKKGKSKSKMAELKGAAGFAEVEDAHSKLISAILTGINRAVPFAKTDSSDARLNKHIDTLFLITHTSTFNISLQALVLIQHISVSLSSTPSAIATSKSVTDRYYRALYASLFDPRLATSSKQAMYLNLFFKSIKCDPDSSGERPKALIRRFLQVLVSGGNGGTEFVAGGLFLLGQLFSVIPGLRDLLGLVGGTSRQQDEVYDPRKRDPQYAQASTLPMWELTILRHHYHPTIALYAHQLLSSRPLTATADLSLHTLSHFLDRFVYKNPKKTVGSGVKAKGTSAMQPAATTVDGTGVKLLKGEVGDAEVVHGETFLKRRLEDVPVDQAFFHRYFTKKREMERARASKAGRVKVSDQSEDSADDESGEEGEEDEEAVNEVDDGDDSDEGEAEIWKAMKSTMPYADEDDLLEDSDEIPSGLDVDDVSEGFDSEGQDGNCRVDDDASVLKDGITPDGLIEYDGSSDDGSEDAVWSGLDEGGRKRKRMEERAKKVSARKKLKSLPTFASYEDYAAMIEADEESS